MSGPGTGGVVVDTGDVGRVDAAGGSTSTVPPLRVSSSAAHRCSDPRSSVPCANPRTSRSPACRHGEGEPSRRDRDRPRRVRRLGGRPRSALHDLRLARRASARSGTLIAGEVARLAPSVVSHDLLHQPLQQGREHHAELVRRYTDGSIRPAPTRGRPPMQKQRPPSNDGGRIRPRSNTREQHVHSPAAPPPAPPRGRRGRGARPPRTLCVIGRRDHRAECSERARQPRQRGHVGHDHDRLDGRPHRPDRVGPVLQRPWPRRLRAVPQRRRRRARTSGRDHLRGRPVRGGGGERQLHQARPGRQGADDRQHGRLAHQHAAGAAGRVGR